jgi:hypothetical protein
MQERKATVLNSLKKQLLERRELENGYAFKFTGTDEMVDERTEFIKTECTCCGFLLSTSHYTDCTQGNYLYSFPLPLPS